MAGLLDWGCGASGPGPLPLPPPAAVDFRCQVVAAPGFFFKRIAGRHADVIDRLLERRVHWPAPIVARLDGRPVHLDDVHGHGRHGPCLVGRLILLGRAFGEVTDGFCFV